METLYVVTIEITEIFRDENHEIDPSAKEAFMRNLAENLKTVLGADDVAVKKVQVFVRE